MDISKTRVGVCVLCATMLAAYTQAARVKVADIAEHSSTNKIDIAKRPEPLSKEGFEARRSQRLKFEEAMKDPVSTALLIIDVQDCFLPGGNLGVPGSDKIISKINKMREDGDDRLWNTVVLSQDYHPAHHISFASSHPGAEPLNFANPEMLKCVDPNGAKMDAIAKALGKTGVDEEMASCCPDYAMIDADQQGPRLNKAGTRYWDARGNQHHACRLCRDGEPGCISVPQILWPDHCVQGTDQVGFNKHLERKVATDIVVRKGTNLDVDSYSAFANNTNAVQTDLHDILQGRKPITTATDHGAKKPELKVGKKLKTPITTVLVTGIAEEVCVMFTAMHAKNGQVPATENYNVILVKDAAKGLSSEAELDAEISLAKMGVIVVSTNDVVDLAAKRPKLTLAQNAAALAHRVFG